MNNELKNKKAIFSAIDLTKYNNHNVENIETIYNNSCSDEMNVAISIKNDMLKIELIESNSCSIAEFGASIFAKSANNMNISKVRELIVEFNAGIENRTGFFAQEYPFLSDLKLRKDCLLMFVNYVERKLDE